MNVNPTIWSLPDGLTTCRPGNGVLKSGEIDMSKTQSRGVSRRTTLGLIGAAAATAAVPGVGHAQTATNRLGTSMIARARALLQSLDETGRAAATFAFESRTRRYWNFMGPSAKPGLPLERMTSAQKELALELLATGLSEDGMRKAEKVMVLQDVLREQGAWPRDRNRDRFSIAIFGTPSESGMWAWRFEGHHLSLSFTLNGDQIVSVTPSSFSSNPNVVSQGRHSGLVALEGEETIARQLYADLNAQQRKATLIRDQAYGNVLTTAGREGRFDTRRGIALSDLSQGQRDLFMRLAETYAVDHLAGPLADAQRKRLQTGDLMSARFGWAGSDKKGEMLYYRLHGDTFVIEFASLRNQPLHLHTIRHDLERNLGAHVRT